MIKRMMRAALRRTRRWLEEEEPPKPSAEPSDVPFDNRYTWMGATFEKLARDPACAKRPHYIWGVLQGVALGKVLGMERISMIEFGVAGGAGLIALDCLAEAVGQMIGIGIDVHGFDSGHGIPKSEDYRDCPNIWMDGQFPMDRDKLEPLLRRAQLHVGLVKDTVPEFLRSAAPPVAFVSFDLDLYTATRDALQLFEASYERLLPRVLCYFDDIIGLTFSDFNGERLAISEFNQRHASRKLSPLYGLKYFVPGKYRHWSWPELFYFAHFFEHPMYNHPDELRKPMFMDLEGNVNGWREVVAPAGVLLHGRAAPQK